MFFRHKPAKTHIPEFLASKEQVEAAERFYESLRHGYAAAVQSARSEIGVFYQSGQVLIRVLKIELLPAIQVLMLTGVAENGDRLVVSGYYKSMDVMFREVKPAVEAQRTPVEFHERAA